MLIIDKARRLMASLFFKAGPQTVLLAMLGYYLISYWGLSLLGEVELVTGSFTYWLVVTASTVGYGDISPSTEAGRLFTSFWVIPAGLTTFSLILARVGFYLSEISTLSKKGLRKVNHKDHIVIIGWNATRTIKLIQMLIHKDNREEVPIVLCVAQDIENPLPGVISFVRVESFTDGQTMKRANIEFASKIIIDTPQDDVTMASALFCEKHSPNSHKTVYFQDESLGEILSSHCPRVEVVPSVSVEMLVKSSIDPGSSVLHKQLLDGTDGMTQYCMNYQGKPLQMEDAFLWFKKRYDATIIAVRKSGGSELLVNPGLDLIIKKDDVIHYVSDARITL